MSLIKCTECGAEISDRATACPHCGCPNDNARPAEDVTGTIHLLWAKTFGGGTWLKTTVRIDGGTVGEMGYGKALDCSVKGGRHEIELYLKKKCKIKESVEISADHQEEYIAFKQTMTNDLVLVPANSTTWGVAGNESVGTSNVPKCPTCGSTNIKKLSTTGKVFSVGMIGLASSSAGKTFACKNCGYRW